ncbi:MAG: AI-2E family transporter [Acholeplasmataceae bacterium]
MKNNRFSKEKLQTILLVIAIITLTIIGLYVFKLLAASLLIRLGLAIGAVLTPFAIAFFLSFVIGPLSIWLKKHLKLSDTLAIVLAIFIGIVFALSIIVIVIIFVVTQMTNIIASLISLIDDQMVEVVLTDLLNNFQTYFDGASIAEIIDELTNQGISFDKFFGLLGVIFVGISNIFSSILNGLFIFVLTPVFLYYLVKEKTYIFESIANIFPKQINGHVTELGKRSDAVIKLYFIGQGKMMLFVAVFFMITYTILSFFIPYFTVTYGLIFGLLMGLLCVIPYLGVWLGMAAPIILLTTLHLEHGQTMNGPSVFIIGIIIVLVLNAIEQVIETAIVQPKVFGDQVHIHPLAVLSSFIFFGAIFGFAGVLLAIPIAGTLKVVFQYLKEINQPKKIEQK